MDGLGMRTIPFSRHEMASIDASSGSVIRGRVVRGRADPHKGWRSTAPRRLGILLLVGPGLGACRRPHLIGFPRYPIREAQGSVAFDLRSIETAALSQAERSTAKAAAWRALLPVLLSLSHDRARCFTGLDTVHFVGADAPPVFLHPRLTWPHIAELELGDGEALAWTIPIVLDRRGLTCSVEPERDLRIEVFDWTEPERAVESFLGEVLRSPPSIRFKFANGREGKAEELMPDGIPLGLRIDVKGFNGEMGHLYGLRVLPRVCMQGALPEPLDRLSSHLAQGEWLKAAEVVEGLDPRRLWDTASAASSFKKASRAVEALEGPSFEEVLGAAASRLARVAGALRRRDVDEIRGALADAATSLRQVATGRATIAPVYLEEGHRGDPFTFVAGGDLQIHEIGAASRFFALLETREESPELPLPYPAWPLENKIGTRALEELQTQLSDAEISDLVDAIGRERLREISSARFVVLAGDCVDGAAGKAVLEYAANLAGLLPPRSPYALGGEMRRFADLVLRCSKPVFAVPGNHDAATGYPGIPNLPFEIVTYVLNQVSRKAASSWRDLTGWFPALVRFHPFGFPPPQYDGLVDWQYLLGPTNLFFHYRGCQFVCFNSFHLEPFHRAAAGGVALNTGGGVQEQDVLWLDVVLDWFAASTLHEEMRKAGIGTGAQFAFMHHDPRGGQPDASTAVEARFGIYEAIDTPIGILTCGYGGLFSYGTRTGIYTPLAAVGLEYLYRSLVGVKGSLAREWMQHSTLDGDAYNARGVVRAIQCHLADRGNGRPGLEALFFAHDNVPGRSQWVRDEVDGHPFRERTSLPWRGRSRGLLSAIASIFVTIDPDEPSRWARISRVPPGRNAQVIRLDDVSDTFWDTYHGFTVFRVGRDHGTVSIEAREVSLPPTR